eukprot:5980086-Pleurochrysis_carterae.AAC.1
MHVNTASDVDDDESAVDSNYMSKGDATLFAMIKASGLPALLKGEILCHNCLDWSHVAKDKSGIQARLPICCQALPARRLH